MNIHVQIKIQARREYPAELFHPIPCDESVFPYWIKKLFNNEFCSSRKCCAVILKREISSVENMPSVFGNKYRNFHWPEPQLLTNDPTVAWCYCFINNCFVIGWCEPWQYRLFQVVLIVLYWLNENMTKVSDLELQIKIRISPWIVSILAKFIKPDTHEIQKIYPQSIRYFTNILCIFRSYINNKEIPKMAHLWEETRVTWWLL